MSTTTDGWTQRAALHCRLRADQHEERARAYESGEVRVCGVLAPCPGHAAVERREAARYARVALYLEERATRKLRRRAA